MGRGGWGAGGGYLPFCASMNLMSGKGGCGICGWMNLSLISHTPSILYFPFAPPHSYHNPFCPHPACETYILISFLLWVPWSMLRHGSKATVSLHETSWIGSEFGHSLKMVWLVTHLMRQSKACGSRVIASVMEQEQVTSDNLAQYL